MKRFCLVMAVLALLCLNVASAYAYVEGFDSGSASWNYGYGTDFAIGSTTWNATGGNPAGHISGASSNLYAIWTYVTAPYGDMTGLSMTIDTKVTDSETGTAQFYIGRGGTYFIDGTWAIGADTNWTTHAVTLDSSHFTSWAGVNNNVYTFAQVLQAPDDIGIFFGGGLASGSGSVMVDNFGTVPEPSSLFALLAGMGSLLALKRRRA
jgi:hypothetical protein